MTVGAWRKAAADRLLQNGNPDAAWDTDWMLCEALSCGRAELRWKSEEAIEEALLRRLNGWLSEREGGRPLQYVLGNTCFMGLDFICDERALIPRQDTETLCELALHRMQHVKKLLAFSRGKKASLPKQSTEGAIKQKRLLL